MLLCVGNWQCSMTQRFGGDVMNTAVYLAREGVPAAFGSALGNDPFSDEMTAMLAGMTAFPLKGDLL